MEVVRIKKILAQNLLIYIGLHCVRRSSWTVTTLATLLCSEGFVNFDLLQFCRNVNKSEQHGTMTKTENISSETTALSHCLDLDLNGKRPGIASDGNFSSYLIGRS